MRRHAALASWGVAAALLAGAASQGRDAGVSVDRSVLPPPPPPSAGTIEQTYRDSTPDWRPVLPVAPPAGAPNVLIVVLDDVGFGHLGSYGGPVETSNLDALAARGLRAPATT